MLPTQSKYPEYVADQLLTADNLNDAFDYLEEGERLTRVNLIGIGIVCGMELRTGSDETGSYITITAGCGITSEGYLVEVPEQTYRRYKAYKALTEITYDKFVTSSPAAERFHLDELVLTSSGEGISDIDGDFLTGKLVIIYVELLLKKAKNCDPESCDDKGSGITVTFRPLVVNIAAEGIQILKDGGGTRRRLAEAFTRLSPIALPRIDVPATDLIDADDVLQAFNALLQGSFPQDLVDNIRLMETILSGLMDKSYGTPSDAIHTQLSLLASGLTTNTLSQLPYYYDYLSDLLEAFNELWQTAEELMAECCPDSALFPRHLLLGAIAANGDGQYRTSFIPSPATTGGSTWLNKLRSLWARLCAMTVNFAPPEIVDSNGNLRLLSTLRITPSRYGSAPLSERAIPFYYNLRTNDSNLLALWNESLSRRNRTNTIQGFAMAGLPNALPQVARPLTYDIEPYNFLRIEGASGMNYSLALREIEQQIAQYRLPIEVIALRTGVGNGPEVFGPALDCYFEDLQLGYELVRREVEAVIGKTTEYLHSFEALPSDIIDKAFGQPRYQPFNQKLITIKTYFVQDLRDFIGSYNEFLALYTDIENDAQAIRETLFRSLGTHNPNRDFTHVSDDNDDFVEDLIDHLDDIVICCEKGGFRAVYEQYARKSEAIYSKLFLSDFLEKNPGIQHKAGVTMGGTFILVCTPPVNRQDYHFVTDITNSPAEVAAPESPQAAPAATSTLVGQPVINNSDITGRKIITDVKEIDFWKKRFEQVNGDNPLTTLAQQLQGGIVIADFFLPYRISECCGDNITFLVNDAEPPEKLSIIVEQKDFCAGADKTITVQGLPEGGELKGQGIVKSADGKSYVFNPSSVKLQKNERMRDVLLTYSKSNSRPVHETIRVYAKPIVNFGVVSSSAANAGQITPITDDQEFSGTVTLGSLSQNAGHFEWTFSDGSPAQHGAQITVQFDDKPGKKTITLKARNGICDGSVSKTLTAVVPGIFLPTLEYCFDTAERPTFILHPKGGFIYNDSAVEQHVVKEGDDYKFVPSAVGLSDQSSRQVTLYYNTPGGQQFSISPKVYAPIRDGNLISSPKDDGLTWDFRAQNTFAQDFEWTFGDGTTDTTSGAQVSHTYPADGGDYNVQVILRNGPCNLTLTNTVRAKKNTCLPLSGIINDFGKIDVAKASDVIINFTDTSSFYDSLGAGENTEAQNKILMDSGAGGKLNGWIARLPGSIGNLQTRERTVQLQVNNVLVRTAFYIACFQLADLEKQPINVVTTMRVITDGISKGWTHGWPAFTASDKALVDELRQIVAKEQELLKAKGGEATKPQYLAALSNIASALQLLK